MKTKSLAICILLSAALLVAAGPGSALSQTGSPGSAEKPLISADGAVKLKRPPTAVRLHLQLIARGKTAEEAMAALKVRREAAVAQLESLKVAKASIAFSALSVISGTTPQQKRLEMMIAQRMGRKKTAKPIQSPTTASALLSAEWPLEGDSPEKSLLVAEALRQQIKAADLSGAKETSKLSSEEQELAEEMADENRGMDPSEDGSNQPGQPQLVFVAKLSDKDRKAALADAFAKAKHQADELAKAAGVNLGQLSFITGHGGGAMDLNQSDPYGRNAFRYYQRQAYGGSEERQDEAMAATPDAIEFNFTVNATFAIEPATRGESRPAQP